MSLILRRLIQNLPLASIAWLVNAHHGPSAIVIMNQYANYGKGHTIHSASQLCVFGTLVHHEAPHNNGGLQQIITPHGLPYMDICVL